MEIERLVLKAFSGETGLEIKNMMGRNLEEMNGPDFRNPDPYEIAEPFIDEFSAELSRMAEELIEGDI